MQNASSNFQSFQCAVPLPLPKLETDLEIRLGSCQWQRQAGQYLKKRSPPQHGSLGGGCYRQNTVLLRHDCIGQVAAAKVEATN